MQLTLSSSLMFVKDIQTKEVLILMHETESGELFKLKAVPAVKANT